VTSRKTTTAAPATSIAESTYCSMPLVYLPLILLIPYVSDGTYFEYGTELSAA
jgi:hypothetical protein